jgi:hypothetical protein
MFKTQKLSGEFILIHTFLYTRMNEPIRWEVTNHSASQLTQLTLSLKLQLSEEQSFSHFSFHHQREAETSQTLSLTMTLQTAGGVTISVHYKGSLQMLLISLVRINRVLSHVIREPRAA